MKKFLLSLALVVIASPAWAAPITIAAWSASGGDIVAGDKTFTYISSSGLTDSNIRVEATDLGYTHQFNLSNLSGVTGAFNLQFSVTVNSGSNTIVGTRVSQNDVSGAAQTSNIQTSGATSYTDVLTATQGGPDNAFPNVTTVIFNTSTVTLDGSNRLQNMSWRVSQASIPEPSTFALAGLAVVGLVITRRRAR
jgi:hypothetical protein